MKKEENTLLMALSDIRQKTGVGVRPMLYELADAIIAHRNKTVAEAKDLAIKKAAKVVSDAMIRPRKPNSSKR